MRSRQKARRHFGVGVEVGEHGQEQVVGAKAG